MVENKFQIGVINFNRWIELYSKKKKKILIFFEIA